MIIVNFFGGFGNQLFQYAFGRAISKKFKVPFLIDKTLLGNKKNNFLLNNFNIKFDGFYNSFKNNRLQKFFLKIKSFNIFNSTKIYFEKFFHFDENITKLDFYKKNYYFYGYWQSFKYFKNILKELKNDLNFNSYISDYKLLVKNLRNTKNISIHIRGGDYKLEPHLSFHGLLTAEYYNSAINYFKKKNSLNLVFLFTNDVKHARKMARSFNFKYKLISTGKSNTSMTDFALFWVSRNKIISNSTFAWWSAILSNNSNVIYPANWFKNKKLATKDLFPKNWKKL
jgi:Glycosyl transferase family 11